MMLRFLFAFFALLPFAAPGMEYEVKRPPSVIADHRMESVRIITQAEMELGELPDHPKITWLGFSSIRLANKPMFGKDGRPVLDVNGRIKTIMQTENRVDFIATSPGVIEFSPIPIVLENKEFFIRIGDLRVEKNQASETDTRLEILWNNVTEIPREVHLGEAVDVHFRELVKRNNERYSVGPFFMQPSNHLDGCQWHQYVRYPGRKPEPADYFFTYSYGRGIFSRGPDNYRESTLRIDGSYHEIRIYKARLYFTKVGKARGHLSATMGTSGSRSRIRTHVLPFEIDVLPIPPIPNSQAIDTGLVGDWQFEASFRPSAPRPAKPFEIEVEIVGQGNPDLRNDFDFSNDGFPAVDSNLYVVEESNYETFWEAEFTQSLLPTGKVGTLPAITLASFDTVGDQWRFHKITPALTLPGFTDVTASMKPRNSTGHLITRPVLLNLPTATFGAFALAPLLPFLFGFVKRRLDSRDPEAKKQAKVISNLISDFRAGRGTPEAIDNDLLPILRTRLGLSPGATAREIADALDDPDLAVSLKTHAKSSFSPSAPSVDFKALATQLAKLSLLLLLAFPFLRAASLEEANQAFEANNYREAISIYEGLIETYPNSASLHFNLAQAHLSSGNAARARAACHTALLLDPLDQETRDLMSEIRERQGDLTVARNRFLDLRPDQWIVLATIIWVLSFLYFGTRKFIKLPRWPGYATIALALVVLATAAWRQTHDYASDQYMVIADELPREPEAGTPDWDFPAFRAGQIVRVSEVNETHARVQSSESSFWLPINQLQQVW